MSDILVAINVNYKSILMYRDIHIIAKRITFIQGTSGCGKSTLLKLFNETVSPDSGNLYYNGISFEQVDSLKLRSEVLLIGQVVYLFEDTIRANFLEFYNYKNLPAPSEETMKYYLSICSAPFDLKMQCATMSGGERQRVYLAICLSFNPKVLMLDEPTSALDEKTATDVMNNMVRFCKEREISLVVVSHDSVLAQRYADEIIELGKRE